MVSVLHEEVEYKVEKLKYKKLEVMQLKTQTWTPRVNKRPSQISPYEVLQSWLIDKVLHLSVKNNKGEGREGLKGGGALNRGFTVKRKCQRLFGYSLCFQYVHAYLTVC